MIRHYGFLNLGRDKKPGSTNRIDEAMLREALEVLGDEQAALFGCEFLEGDDNNELAIARRVLKGWTMYAGALGRRVREPIFLSPDQPPARWRVTWTPGTAVEKWSPQRSVLRVHLDDTPETLLARHNAAGARGQGDRPAWALKPLNDSFSKSQTAGIRAKRAAHRAGRHATELADLNHYALPGLPGEDTIFHERTDYGRAYPAAGFRTDFHQGRSGTRHVDSHRLRTMHGTYRPKERP